MASVLDQLARQPSFQSRVFAAYEALHYALGNKFAAPADGQANGLGGVLAGACIVSDSLAGAAAALPLASAIAGACFLGMDGDVELAHAMLRQGRCDFVVNSLDEALRILKNELRQKKPVSVCLAGSVAENIQQMAERGVAPDLLMQAGADQPSPATQRLVESGAIFCRSDSVDELLARPANHHGEIARWTLPHGTAAMLARLDSVALALLPAADRQRRRWLEAAQRYVPREGPPSRIASFSHVEQERFLDAVCARIMSGEVLPPVAVEVAGETMLLGGEGGT
jgi:urocanate hydratase